MKTLRSLKKKLKRTTRKRDKSLDRTINMYAYEDILFTRIGRYAYHAE